jgi:hypothetical protein
MPLYQVQTRDGIVEVEASNEQALERAIAEIPGTSPKGVMDTIGDLGRLHQQFQRAAAQGATLGWAPEIVARGQELVGRGSYEENLERTRAELAAIPGAIRYPSEAVGAAATGIASAPLTGSLAAATGASRLPWIARAIGAGAGTGALFGAGEAPPGQRLQGAAEGALVGGGLAIPTAGLGALGSKALQGAAGYFAPETAAEAEIARAMARDVASPEGRQEVAQQLAAARTGRPGAATLLDIGGENITGLGERIAATPGAGRAQLIPTLTAWQREQRTRIADDLRDALGTTQSATATVDDMIASQAANARPLYRIAQDFQAERVPEVAAAFQDATRSGYGRAAVNSRAFRQLLESEYGVERASDAPLMAQIDAFKRTLDDNIGAAIRVGRGNEARVMTNLKKDLLATVDQYNPAYAQARQAFAGPAAVMDALEQGKGIYRISSEELPGILAGMTDSERQAFRDGAFTQIVGRIGDDPAKLPDLTKYVRSPAMREKIGMLIQDPALKARWEQAILPFEMRRSEYIGRITGGSPTARRRGERKDADDLVLDLLADGVLHGSPMGLLSRALSGTRTWLKERLRPKIDKAVAAKLIDPNVTRDVFQRAQAYRPPSPALPAAAVGGALAPPTAQQLGGTP